MLIGSCFFQYACQRYHRWLVGTRWLGQPARLQQWDSAAAGRFGLTAWLGGFKSLWKVLFQIAAVCRDILMSDLGTLVCGTDEKRYKLINKTREDALRNVWIVNGHQFYEPGPSCKQWMRCRFTKFGSACWIHNYCLNYSYWVPGVF